MKPCSVDQCHKKLMARGLCQMHYNRLRRSGNLELAPRRYRRKPTGIAGDPDFWGKVKELQDERFDPRNRPGAGSVLPRTLAPTS